MKLAAPVFVGLVWLAVSPALAAPVPSIESASVTRSLRVDTTYYASDDDATSATVYIRNTGNQSLQMNAVQGLTQGGLTITCSSGCSSTSISPGSQVQVSLWVKATEAAVGGITPVQFPFTFANAASVSASLPISVSRIDAGIVSASVSIDEKQLTCPASSPVVWTAALTLRNNGDTEVKSLGVTINSPPGASVTNLPGQVAPHTSTSATVRVTTASPAMLAELHLSGTIKYETTRSRPPAAFTQSASFSLPVGMALTTDRNTGEPTRVDGGTISILQDFAVPITVQETCGYLPLTVSPSLTGNRMRQDPPGSFQVSPGASTTVVLHVEPGLNDLTWVCSGFSGQAAFRASAANGFTRDSSVEVQAIVDVAGVRSGLQTLSATTTGSQELTQAIAAFTNASRTYLDAGSCSQSGTLRGLLSLVGPMGFVLESLERASMEMQALRWQDAADELSGALITASTLDSSCNDVVNQISTACHTVVSSIHDLAVGWGDRIRQGLQLQQENADLEQGIQATQTLARLHGALGQTEEAAQLEQEAAEKSQHVAGLRSQGLAILLEQRATEAKRGADARFPTEQDFRSFTPFGFFADRTFLASSLERYAQAEALASQAGDDALAAQISEASSNLQSAYSRAAPVNYAMLAAWAGAILGLAFLGTVRARRARSETTYASSGDALFAR
jgi:hypothetical protein